MDLSWGYDYSHSSHSNYIAYQHQEFTGSVDYRISTLGIDIETPVEWTCEDLQEIMNEDTNSLDYLLRSQSDKDLREDTPAFQHILSDLLRTESDFLKIDFMSRRRENDLEKGTKDWHYANHLLGNESSETSTSNDGLTHDVKQEDALYLEGAPVNSQTSEHRMYPLTIYEPEAPGPTQPAILRRTKQKLELPPANEITVTFTSCSPLPSAEGTMAQAFTKNQLSEESFSPKPLVETPKKKCHGSPLSTATPSPIPSPAPVKKLTTTVEVPVPKPSPPPKPDTTVELGPFCKSAGIISSDLDQTSLPEGRVKLPADALTNGIIVELYGYWRQMRSPRRTFVRFLSIYFDIKFLDESNPTVVDRLFRRVIAPLLGQRNELIKHSGISITRQLVNPAKLKLRKSHDALAEFDSAVFVIPDFVTDPQNRRSTCAGRAGAAASSAAKDRRTPLKKPAKPTQAQQLVELQARFDAFRRVQRKHNLAFLRHLNRLQTKVDKLTHRLSKRLSSGRNRPISNVSN